MSSRRRLHGKQADPRISSLLPESLPWLVDFLGLRVFSVASVCRRCLHLLDADGRVVATVLSEPVSFSGIRSADAAAKALFKRIPEHLAHLDLDFRKACIGSQYVRTETLEILAETLPHCISCIRLDLGYASPPAALLAAIVSQSAGSLRELQLQGCMELEAFKVLARRLPQSLTKLSLELGPFLEANDEACSLLVQGLPSGLLQLSLGLEDIASDGLLEDLAQRMTALQQLETLSLDLRQSDLHGNGIKAMLEGLPPGLTRLDLKLEANDLTGRAVAHAFGHALQSLRRLEVLSLDFEECIIHRNLPACVVGKLPTSLVELSLEFGACDLDHDAVQGVGQAMAALPGLRELSLGFRGCSAAGGAAVLGRHLPPGLMGLSLNFFNSDVGDADALAVALSLPQGLRRLRANFGGCAAVTPSCLRRLLEVLPGGLRELRVEFEWRSLSQVTFSCLPQHLEAFELHANALYEGHTGPSPVLPALADSLWQLRTLRELRLNFELCDLRLRQARRILQSLPSSVLRAELDFGGRVTSQDTEERWLALLGPAKQRYGGSVRIPTTDKSSAEIRASLHQLFTAAEVAAGV